MDAEGYNRATNENLGIYEALAAANGHGAILFRIRSEHSPTERSVHQCEPN